MRELTLAGLTAAKGSGLMGGMPKYLLETHWIKLIPLTSIQQQKEYSRRDCSGIRIEQGDM